MSRQDLLARSPAGLSGHIRLGSPGWIARLTGVIRISAPVTFGEIYVGGMLGRFAAAHPGLDLDFA